LLKLPDVTLAIIETRQHQLAYMALRDCLAKAAFDDVLVFTDRPQEFEYLQPRIVKVPDWKDKIGWSRCNWQEVSPHVHTRYVLSIQWDAWIVDTSCWRPEFLEYDYCGAPWFYRDGMNVGTGGFCLKSAALMRYLRKHRDRFPCINALDDDLLCRKYRPALQEAGFRWAPEELAIEFAFECVRLHNRTKHFGFHASYNFDYGCQFDRDRIMERARVMVRSLYIHQNPMWEGFVKSNPWVPEALQAEGIHGPGPAIAGQAGNGTEAGDQREHVQPVRQQGARRSVQGNGGAGMPTVG
jgi:hypothetical protein